MSAVFRAYGAMHVVLSEREDGTYRGRPRILLTSPCGICRIVTDDPKPWVYDAYPTCLRCALKDTVLP